MNERDEFYIGWEDKAPRSYGRSARRAVVIILVLAVFAGLGFAASQRLIGVAFFEWGEVRDFSGILRVDPYPHLVLRVEATNAPARVIAAPLVAPFKFGLRRDALAALDGKPVKLRATRIHRDDQLMLEAEPGSIRALESSPGESGKLDSPRISPGHQTFRGEIVDSKCWMGVMNPGVLTPHRACAVRCISGGIPPMLLVRRENAPPLNLLLVSADGKPVNEQVIEFVAEPIEITGEVVREGELLTLRADPASYRRIPR
ncbi:MAG TPA: hypothetical protein VI454_12245 [Verrucomicrobiae bacterium]|jgi:hypothetical protein